MRPRIFHEANATAPALHFLQMRHSAESNLEIRSHWPRGGKEVGGKEKSGPEMKMAESVASAPGQPFPPRAASWQV